MCSLFALVLVSTNLLEYYLHELVAYFICLKFGAYYAGYSGLRCFNDIWLSKMLWERVEDIYVLHIVIWPIVIDSNWFFLIIITALSPHWDSDMNFKISIPELCLIRFCVRDQTGLLSSDFVGQYTLPFTSLKKGEPHRQKEREGAEG